MQVHLHVTQPLGAALLDLGLEEGSPGAALVFESMGHAEWEEARAELGLLFRLSRAAAAEGQSVVYVVELDALLGRAGAPPAMTAAGIVSAGRTLALELRKGGARANTIVTNAEASPETVAAWVTRLLAPEPDGPSGEVIHLGGLQVGKALS